MAWRPLREVILDDEVWALYVALALGGYPPTRDLDIWSFARQSQRLALPFDERATIAVETFEVVHVVGRPG